MPLSSRHRNSDAFPSRIVGWLNIWDIERDNIQRHCTEGRKCLPLFQPYFCILRQDLKTFQCFRAEEDADDAPSLVRLPSIRLDDGKQQFDRRWGYEALESIKENAMFHCHYMTVSTERLYKNQLDTTFNESLPDLSRSYDSSLFPKRRHVFKKFFHGNPRRAYDSFKRACERAEVSKPQNITRTNLRTYMSTLAQVMNLSSDEMQQMCRHLGHTIRVHLANY